MQLVKREREGKLGLRNFKKKRKDFETRGEYRQIFGKKKKSFLFMLQQKQPYSSCHLPIDIRW